MPRPIGIGRHWTLVLPRAVRSRVEKDSRSPCDPPLRLAVDAEKRRVGTDSSWQKMHGVGRICPRGRCRRFEMTKGMREHARGIISRAQSRCNPSPSLAHKRSRYH